MKALGIIAAAIIGLVAAPTPAAAYVQAPVAQPAVALVSTADVVQRDDRRWDRGRNWDRGRHRGWDNRRRWRWRTACHNQWRRGHRERVCRRVRYR